MTESVKCPLGMEASHLTCSAGYCDVCQNDLRGRLVAAHKTIAKLRETLKPFVDAYSYVADTASRLPETHIMVHGPRNLPIGAIWNARAALD